MCHKMPFLGPNPGIFSSLVDINPLRDLGDYPLFLTQNAPNTLIFVAFSWFLSFFVILCPFLSIFCWVFVPFCRCLSFFILIVFIGVLWRFL